MINDILKPHESIPNLVVTISINSFLSYSSSFYVECMGRLTIHFLPVADSQKRPIFESTLQ